MTETRFGRSAHAWRTPPCNGSWTGAESCSTRKPARPIARASVGGSKMQTCSVGFSSSQSRPKSAWSSQARVRSLDEDDPARAEQARRLSQRGHGVGQMLQGMDQCHRVKRGRLQRRLGQR